MGYRFSIVFGPQGARKPRQDCRTQPASTEVARVSYRVQLHPAIPQRQCQRGTSFLSRPPLPATELDLSGPSSLNPSDEERVFLIRSHGLLLGAPCAMCVALGWLAPSDPSPGLDGLTLSGFPDFRQHGPRKRVDNLDAPSGEFVARAPLHVASRGANWVLPVNARTSGSLAASVFTVPATPLPSFVDGSDLSLHAVPPELPISLHNDSALLPTPVATPASTTAVLHKAALAPIPPALPVDNDCVVRQMDSGPQAPSAVSHPASRVAGTNGSQIPVVLEAPPLLPSHSQTALPSLLPSELVSSRTRRRRATAAGKLQTAVDYGFDRSDPTPPTVPRPAPTAPKPRPPRGASPAQVTPWPSIDPVPTVPIQHTTDAATPAPPLLGTFSPEAPRRASTLAALSEMPSPAEIEFLESVERYSHTDRARERHAEPVCDAAIR